MLCLFVDISYRKKKEKVDPALRKESAISTKRLQANSEKLSNSNRLWHFLDSLLRNRRSWLREMFSLLSLFRFLLRFQGKSTFL